MSPLARGAWIETKKELTSLSMIRRRPSQEGRGLKLASIANAKPTSGSPLARGAWIETGDRTISDQKPESPLARGAWIET